MPETLARLSSIESETKRVGLVANAISTGIVRLLAEYTGRGPTKARTYIHDDSVVVVLADTLTKSERRLIAAGEDKLVLNTRSAFQEAMKYELIAVVEECTGRKVNAFLSANTVQPDYGTETFILAPDQAKLSLAQLDNATLGQSDQ